MSRILWLLLLLTACTDTAGPSEGLVCSASVDPAIVVSLVDIVTGSQGLPGFPHSAELMARRFGSVRDGDYVDSLRALASNEDTLLSVRAAPERPGRYDVLVRIEGYRDWQTLGVAVEPGVCHVQTVELRAVLQPARKPQARFVTRPR